MSKPWESPGFSRGGAVKDAILFVVSMMLIFSVPIGLSLFSIIGRLLGAP